jgi:hypothetical protein
MPRGTLPRNEGPLALAHQKHRIAAIEGFDGRAVGGTAGA